MFCPLVSPPVRSYSLPLFFGTALWRQKIAAELSACLSSSRILLQAKRVFSANRGSSHPILASHLSHGQFSAMLPVAEFTS